MLDVEVVEQSTGDFFVSGGYSTTDGAAGRGQGRRSQFLRHRQGRAGIRDLRPIRARDRSAASEPYFLGTTVSAGIELFGRQNYAEPLSVLRQQHLWRDHCSSARRSPSRLGVQCRYSLYNQNVTLDPNLAGRRRRCRSSRPPPPGRNGFPRSATPSLTARSITTKSPTSGINSQLSQDLAGPRRRREIPAHHRGRALLPLDQR